jgi:dihydroorotate dehydrogenase (NAD+) catalytic subunit
VSTARIIRSVKKRIPKPVVAKLTPNVTDITEIAWACQDAGADAVALVNTFLGMAVDTDTMMPLLGNITGGLSGPAIKPLALRAVWETYKKVSIPIIGIGGIMTGKDAAEFVLCGASAVQVGTANFVDPTAALKILEELREYMAKHKMNDIQSLTGRLRIPA